jgi:hypothetical protein
MLRSLASATCLAASRRQQIPLPWKGESPPFSSSVPRSNVDDCGLTTPYYKLNGDEVDERCWAQPNLWSTIGDTARSDYITTRLECLAADLEMRRVSRAGAHNGR